jgi:hypothetical protein
MTTSKGYCGPIWYSADGEKRITLEYSDSDHLVVRIQQAAPAGHWYDIAEVDSDGAEYRSAEEITPQKTIAKIQAEITEIQREVIDAVERAIEAMTKVNPAFSKNISSLFWEWVKEPTKGSFSYMAAYKLGSLTEQTESALDAIETAWMMSLCSIDKKQRLIQTLKVKAAVEAGLSLSTLYTAAAQMQSLDRALELAETMVGGFGHD